MRTIYVLALVDGTVAAWLLRPGLHARTRNVQPVAIVGGMLAGIALTLAGVGLWHDLTR